MSREIATHKVNGLNEALNIEVVDEPGPGNANHHYVITFHDERYGYDRIARDNGCCVVWRAQT